MFTITCPECEYVNEIDDLSNLEILYCDCCDHVLDADEASILTDLPIIL